MSLQKNSILSASLIAAGLLASTTGHAMDEGDWSIDINGLSWHSSDSFVENNQRRDYNETNPGLGGSYALSDDIDIKGGFFKNSYYRTSVYGGVFWHRDFTLSGDWSVAPGVGLYLVSGYDNTPENAPALAPLPVPGLSIGNKAMRVNLGVVPWGNVDFATFQIQIVPAGW